MKRTMLSLILVFTFIILTGCSNESDGKIHMPSSSDDYKGLNYKEVTSELQESGFTNIKTEVLDDLVTGWLTKDGEVEKVDVNGDTTFSTDSKYQKDIKIVVIYHTFPEETTATSVKTDSSQKTSKKQNNKTLTIKNNEELSAVLLTKNEFDPIIKKFAEKYSMRTIEFDGYISNVTPYKDYDTRFDVLMYVGDYRTENFYGPNIKMENVGITEYPDVQESTNQNVHIVAEVWDYDENQGLLMLTPIAIKTR